ncbi:predicted protein, partial [Nematostella vectensis]
QEVIGKESRSRFLAAYRSNQSGKRFPTRESVSIVGKTPKWNPHKLTVFQVTGVLWSVKARLCLVGELRARRLTIKLEVKQLVTTD